MDAEKFFYLFIGFRHASMVATTGDVSQADNNQVKYVWLNCVVTVCIVS